MTQAPTPGPLSVGDRVVAIADLRQAPNGAVWIKEGEEALIVREFGVNGCLVGVLTDEGHEGEWAKTCFRLAPTAPVEASGSERDGYVTAFYDIAKMLGIGARAWSPAETWHREMRPKLEAALRPQPSGETREAVWTYCPECGSDEIGHEEGDHKQCGVCGQEWFSDIDYSDVVQKNLARLALLSAHPLALGGQQGEEVLDSGHGSVYDRLLTLIHDRDHALRGETSTDPNEIDETVREILRITTPARAEAQDEGAAGYKAALIDDLRRYYNDCTPPQMHYAQSDGLAFALDTAIRLLSETHPSPTPAADADRVRIAVEALDALQDLFAREGECSMERFERIAEMFRKDTGYLAPGKDPGMLSQQPEGDELRRIYDDWFANKIASARRDLAALKSTAAKEGGAL